MYAYLFKKLLVCFSKVGVAFNIPTCDVGECLLVLGNIWYWQIFFFHFMGSTHHMEVPGSGTESVGTVTYTTTVAMPDALIHCAEHQTWTSAATWAAAVRFLTHCTMEEAPRQIFFFLILAILVICSIISLWFFFLN